MRAHSPLFVSESSQSLHSLSRLCRRALSQTCLRLALITTLVGGCAVDDTLQVSGCLPGEVVERTCERCLCGADGELEGCEEIACDGVLSKELPPPPPEGDLGVWESDQALSPELDQSAVAPTLDIYIDGDNPEIGAGGDSDLGASDPPVDGLCEDGNLMRSDEGCFECNCVNGEWRCYEREEECALHTEEVDYCTDWAIHPFDYPADEGSCAGLQLTRFDQRYGLWVGVTLCDGMGEQLRVYLNDIGPNAPFMPIGDTLGWGQDHCELINPQLEALTLEEEISSGGCTSCSIEAPIDLAGVAVFSRARWGERFSALLADEYDSFQSAQISCGFSLLECFSED